MSKLQKYASKSPIMEVKIVYNKEKIQFNLDEELIIDQNLVNDEILEHANKYAYLAMLHNRLISQEEGLESTLEKRFEQLVNFYLSDKSSDYYLDNGKFPPKNSAETFARADEEYQELQNKLLKTRANRRIIEVCVRAFEQRKDLIQSLSANIRKGY